MDNYECMDLENQFHKNFIPFLRGIRKACCMLSIPYGVGMSVPSVDVDVLVVRGGHKAAPLLCHLDPVHALKMKHSTFHDARKRGWTII